MMEHLTVRINKTELKAGQKLAEDICDRHGKLVAARNTLITEAWLGKLLLVEDLQTILIYDESGISAEEKEDIPLVNNRSVVQSPVVIKMIRRKTCENIKAAVNTLADESGSCVNVLLQIVEQVLFDVLNSDEILLQLDRIRSFDDYFSNHTIKTAVIAIAVGIAMSMNREELKSLAKGAFFCDIGKMQIDRRILEKPGVLSDEEFKEMKRSPEYGYSFLKNNPSFDENSLKCILEARERWDGNGYPRGLKGNEISLYGQIAGFASFFDAVTTDRPYRFAVDVYQAMGIAQKEIGGAFNRDMIAKAIQILGYYNVGMAVRLKTGELAKVIRVGRYRPTLRIFFDPNTGKSEEGYEIDMKKNPAIKISSVIVPEAEDMDRL